MIPGVSTGIAYAAGGLAITLALAAGVQTVRVHQRDLTIAEMRADAATLAEQYAEAARAQEAKYREQEHRDAEAIQLAREQRDLANSRSDAAAVSSAGAVHGLQQRIAALRAAGSSCPAGAASAPSPQGAASTPINLLAELSGRMADDGRAIAEYADRLKAELAACVAAWPAP